ncbi:DUF262 domain-containing HNH endonuclease family protein [Haladaptatus sp. T7]|uniref:DUF262 domain-containing HNH endonuclease family protein n=1 Tax=Haladaptatus sp. T7 TaxID=2029368 RepID=UPI0021A25575|nr:DUF262 domain-containing HNH endonuclease family protein [Haladaptatus sp. T7]GKZ16082.1 hypothetical protein HAL_39630 [Haladaptatus sp. T7]
MSSQSTTIANVVKDLNEGMFLPGIQREFVWSESQIRQLFDSIMQGYPIGSLLFWEVRDTFAREQIKYRFIKHYIEDGVHPPSFSDRSFRNPKIDEKFDKLPNKLSLVLDGQQRLTAFYIGLCGSYTKKKKYQRRRDPESWSRKKLYFNLLSDPSTISNTDPQMRYDFRFLSDPSNSTGEYWYDVSRILGYSSNKDIDEEIKHIQEKLEEEGLWQEGYFQQIYTNLSDFYSSIHETNNISYHTETKENHERVLDIFIRANEGGTQLSKTEILLSISTAHWTNNEPELDAREELTSFVDGLNGQYDDAGFNFDISFALRGLMLLSDIPAGYSLSSFSHGNVIEMKEMWMEEGVQESIRQAIDLLVEFGYNGQRLTSVRAPLPIAYFFYHNNENKRLSQSSKTGKQARNDIHFWLASMIINGTFAIGETPIIEARSAINDAEQGTFPLKEINRRLRGGGRPVGLDRETISTLLRDQTSKAFSLLSLIHYPLPAKGSTTFHEDHIFPRSKLDTEYLIEEKGLTYEYARQCEELKNCVANKQLLTDSENMKKSNKDFAEWLKSRDQEYFDSHLIPQDPDLHEVENFVKFIDKREEMVIEHLSEKFGF